MPLTVKRCLISPQKTTYTVTAFYPLRQSTRPSSCRPKRQLLCSPVVKPLGICEIRQSEIGDLSTWHQRTTALSATTAAFTPLQDAPLSSSARNGPSPPPSLLFFSGDC